MQLYFKAASPEINIKKTYTGKYVDENIQRQQKRTGLVKEEYINWYQFVYIYR